MSSRFRTTTAPTRRDLLTHVGEPVRERSDASTASPGAASTADGRSSPSWKRDAAVLTEHNLWNRAISYTIFLRREVVEPVGPFDERLGLGSGGALGLGRGDRLPRPGSPKRRADRVRPVAHRPATTTGRRRDIGLPGRRQRRLPAAQARLPAHAMRGRMLVRPGGRRTRLARHAAIAARARYHAATLRGRLRGLPARRAAANSAA